MKATDISGQPAPHSQAADALAVAATHSGATLRHTAIVAALLIVAGAVGGMAPRWIHRQALGEETRDLAVTTVVVVTPTISRAGGGMLLPAEIKPAVESPIYARATGYLKRYIVDIGASVKEGDLLAEIDAPELNQELAQARAQLDQAKAALRLARTTADRWNELLKSASVSEQETAEKQADLELKTANVEAAQANMRRLEDLQSFQRVTAPFAGVITTRTTDVGQLIAATSGKELFRLAQTDRLRVFVRTPQTLALGVAVGQTAELTVSEYPGRVFSARVVRTSGVLSADSRTLLTELEVDNSRGEILCGSYAQIRFLQAEGASAMTVPANALLFRADGAQVVVVGPDNKIEMRHVVIGRDFGPTTEIISGLSATDQVVMNPPDSLETGLVVQATKEEDK